MNAMKVRGGVAAKSAVRADASTGRVTKRNGRVNQRRVPPRGGSVTLRSNGNATNAPNSTQVLNGRQLCQSITTPQPKVVAQSIRSLTTRVDGKDQTAMMSVKCQAAASAAAGDGDKEFLGVKMSTLKKVVPLGVMFFCILFNYTILRDTKDVLVVTAPGSGAEIIPFLKVSE